MKNPLDQFSTLPMESLLKAADDAAIHRQQLEYVEMVHINNPHRYSEEDQQELINIMHLVISLENEIHAEIQGREAARVRQWL